MNAVKSFLLIALASFALIACDGKKEEAPAPMQEPEAQPTRLEKATFQSFKDSKVWVGTFHGDLPSASGEGIDFTIKLNDDLSYERTEVYKGKKGGKFEDKGKFSWNEAGDVIIIKTKSETHQFKVKDESTILMLNQDGTENSGELADMYVLKKVEAK